MPNTQDIFSEQDSGKKPPLRRMPLIIAFVVLIPLIALVFILLSAKTENDETSVTQFSTASVERKTIRDLVSVSGVLELSRREIITAPGPGIVEQVFIDEGSIVKVGDVLMSINSEDLQAELENKRLSLEKLLRQAAQNDAEQAFSRKQSELDIRAGERQLEEAERAFSAAEALLAKNLVSESDFLQAQSTYYAALDALEQTRLKKEQSEVLYQLTLRNNETDKTLLEAEITELEEKIAAYTVRASSAGTVYSISVESSSSVSAYEELAVVADPSDSRAALDVPETRSASVQKGMDVTVYVGSQAYPAQVDSIAPSATSSSSSSGAVVRVVASFLEKPERPTIGASLSAEIVAGTIKDALVLPRGPYLSSGNYASAYVVEENTATRKNVSYGIADGAYIQVVSGLNEGDTILTSDYRDFIHLDSVHINRK